MKRSIYTAKAILAIVIFLAVVAAAHGATKTFTGPGNFSDATKWSGASLPVPGDDLLINGTCTVDNSASTDNVAYGTLVIGSASAGTLNWAASGTNRLSVTHASASIAASALDMTNGGTLIIRGTWTANNLSFTPGTGTLEVQSTMTLPSAYASYNHLKINASANTVTAGLGTSAASFTMTAGTFNLNALTLAVTGTATFTAGTINNGTVTCTGTTTTFAGTTFGATVIATSDALYLNGSTFNSAATLTKNGATDIVSNGGNTFNAATTIACSGSGYFALAYITPDIFNAATTLTSSGTNILYPAFNSGGNQFNGDVTFNNIGTGSSIQCTFGGAAAVAFNGNMIVNSSSTGGIYFGGVGGTSTLATGKTISVGGAGFSQGTLYLSLFNQMGTTAQTITLTGSALLQVGPSATWNAAVTFTSPQLLLNGGTYNGTASFTKNGAVDNASNGGNTFNSTVTITKSGLGYIAMGNALPDIFNAAATFNNLSDNHIWLAHNSSGNQFNGDVTFNNSGTGYIVSHFAPGATAAYNGNIVVTNSSPSTTGGIAMGGFGGSAGTLATGKTITIGGGGFTNGNLLLSYFTQSGATPQSLTLSGVGLLTAGPSLTMNGNTTFIAPQLTLNGCTFNGTCSLQKTGATQNNSLGGNTFNAATTIANSGTGSLVLGYPTGIDVFNGDLTLTNTNTGGIYPAYNTAGHQFNGNIIVNQTANGNIYFGGGTGTSTLASGKTITVGGSGFTTGILTLRNFTQAGATAQAMTLTSSSSLVLGPGTTFNGNVNFIAIQMLLNGTTFNGTAYLRKSGSVDNASTGGNVFNGTTTIANSGSGSFDLGNTSPETFNTHLTITNTGTSRIQIGVGAAGNLFNGNVTINHGGNTSSLNTVIARSVGSTATINGNLVINNTNSNVNSGVIIGNDGNVAINGNVTVSCTNGRGVLFGAATGTVTLGNGYTIADGGAGTFTTGILSLRQFIQTGTTAQNITLTGTANLTISASSQFNGAINFIAPQVYVQLSTFNGTASFTKTGATDNISTGGNTFNAATSFTNSGTGFLRLASSFGDDFNAGATFSQTGSGLLQPAYASTSNAFAGNISTTGTAAAISFGTGNGTVTLNGTSAQAICSSLPATFYNLGINNATGGVTLQQNITVSNTLTLTNGALDLNSKTLTVSNPATTGITSSNGFLMSEQIDHSSKVAWAIGTTTGPHKFPFGALGDTIPLTLNLTAGDIGTVTVSTYHTNLANQPLPTTPVAVTTLYDDQGDDNSLNVVDRFWQIDKTGPSGTAAITFVGTGSEVNGMEGVVAQRWDSNTLTWDAPIGGQVNITNGVTVTGVTLMGPYALVAGAAPLPVQLLTFEARPDSDEVDILWSTVTEINSDRFEVERSVDGIDFQSIVTVPAAGQSASLLRYAAVDDDPLPGTSYYRLRQVDIDGGEVLSEQVQVEFLQNSRFSILAAPNPTTADRLCVRILGAPDQALQATLTDMQGRVVHESSVSVDSGEAFHRFTLQGDLPAGLYGVTLRAGSAVCHTTVMIR